MQNINLSVQSKEKLFLFGFIFIMLLISSGGRIAGSDETGFFLETQSLIENFSFSIPDTIVGNGVYGKDGKYYLGAGLSYTIISIPFYVIGKTLNEMFSVPQHYQLLVLKAAFSLTNQFLGALIGVLLYLFSLKFNFSKKTALLITLIFLFTTNFYAYTKSSMREPLIILCLMAASYYYLAYKNEKKVSYLHYIGIWQLALIHTKILYLFFCLIFFLYFISLHIQCDKHKNFQNKLFSIFKSNEFRKHGIVFIFWLLISVLLYLLQNYLMFGSIFSTFYSKREITFSNPIFSGLYGLLLSSGKSIFLYAPVIIIVFWGIKKFYSSYKKETILFLTIVVLHLVIHAKYYAWAGDGSWGPRYVLPIIPFLILMSGFTIESILTQAGRLKKYLFYAICIIGLIIQIGGSAVYFGSYLRYIGEFPFQKEFTDPEFLYKSHYIPNFSPVTGHWELLVKSVEKHLNGDMKNFTITASPQRLPISGEDQKRIVYIIDFWFMYAYYAGINGFIIIFTLVLSVFITIVLGIKTFSVIKKPEPHAVNPNSGHCSSL